MYYFMQIYAKGVDNLVEKRMNRANSVQLSCASLDFICSQICVSDTCHSFFRHMFRYMIQQSFQGFSFPTSSASLQDKAFTSFQAGYDTLKGSHSDIHSNASTI
ncbi:hypothetical protein SAMN05444062_11280 [Pseudomonas syringae]|nr:hypothetical protein SAMN05444062_11280 [Pseudomonas syringae]